MDYHRETGTVTFIYNVLDLEKDKEYYEAIPMTFIVEKQRLILSLIHIFAGQISNSVQVLQNWAV